MPIELRFESTLAVSPGQAWSWITDVDRLREEMRPWLRMTVPAGIRNLEDLAFQPGEPLFTSHLWLFGCLPLGTSRLTLRELNPGVGFVEESPMTGMRLWRHERRLEVQGNGTRVIDRLTVEPLFGAPLVRLFLRLFFANRHRVLRHRAP
ncbi:hypothetical protein ABS648_24990 [Pseudomonas solani]|uniref:Ligand-binding SRPBCC domain-containing protein n=1 Tax=Pseudomonas solani TaxID=2731552 RepID=A0AAU7Y047_9PSED|nr:hypothetical protein L682_02945 [Pseudomonas alcaligenes OT 69]MDN4146299.1 hypothetical protein [Pseudomonas tohonis]